MERLLQDVKYALESLLDLVWKERTEMDNLIKKKNNLVKKLAHDNELLDFLSHNPDLDDEGIGTMIYWSEIKTDIPTFNELEKKILDLKEEIRNKQYSIDTLSSSILQIAKQGIIRKYGNLESCKNGRKLKDLLIKEIIWYGRNQGMHFEEGDLNSTTKGFFEKLIIKYPNLFKAYLQKNMSFKILGILDWNTYNNLEKDMLSFST